MAVDETAWAEIRCAYAGSTETIREIAYRFGINERNIYKQAVKEGWPKRSERRGRAVGRSGPVHPVPPGHPTRSARDALTRRLYAAIAKKLKQLETRMIDDPDLTQDESERQTRELGSMVSAFEKVKKMQDGDADKDKDRARGLDMPTIATVEDIERLRNEIAERIERAWIEKQPEVQSGNDE